MMDRHSRWLFALLAVSVLAGCSTQKASEEAGAQAAQKTEKAKQVQQPAESKTAPTSGPLACAQNPAPFWETKVGAPQGTVNPQAPVRLNIPEGLKAIEPPAQASKPVEGGTCEGAVYSSATQSLVGRGRAFPMCCKAKAQGSDFTVGCMNARGCTLSVPTPKGVQQVNSMDELTKAIGTVDTAAEAIGLAALYDHNVWVPYGGHVDDEIAKTGTFFKWAPVRDKPVEVQAEEHPWGWVLRLPAYRQCGCHHDLYRVTYRVTRDGGVCRLGEKPQAIARAQTSVCID